MDCHCEFVAISRTTSNDSQKAQLSHAKIMSNVELNEALGIKSLTKLFMSEKKSDRSIWPVTNNLGRQRLLSLGVRGRGFCPGA